MEETSVNLWTGIWNHLNMDLPVHRVPSGSGPIPFEKVASHLREYHQAWLLGEPGRGRKLRRKPNFQTIICMQRQSSIYHISISISIYIYILYIYYIYNTCVKMVYIISEKKHMWSLHTWYNMHLYVRSPSLPSLLDVWESFFHRASSSVDGWATRSKHNI